MIIQDELRMCVEFLLCYFIKQSATKLTLTKLEFFSSVKQLVPIECDDVSSKSRGTLNLSEQRFHASANRLAKQQVTWTNITF